MRRVHVVSGVDAVADDLRGRVLDGGFAPGTALREVALSEEFGVGRHTLRAALGVLTHEGLVVREPHRGVFVPQLSTDDVRDLFFFRTALEVEAARSLTSRQVVPEEALERLRDMESLPKDVAWSTVVDSDLALHEAIVAAVGSPRLIAAYRNQAAEIRLCISQLRPFYGLPDKLAAEHRLLLDAILSADSDVAEAQVRSHLARAMADLTRDA